MTITQIIILALVQGLTEFLPVSSSAHLVLTPKFFGWQDQGLAFDVAVHVGSLIAVVGYLRKDIYKLLTAWIKSIAARSHSSESHLAWSIILGSIPLGLGGLLLHDLADTVFRSPIVIAWATIGFGLLLWFVDYYVTHRKPIENIGYGSALFIGSSQVLALIPGTSRSGITMTTALMLGFTRQAAARFSFLLSIPAIGMAGGYKGLKLIELPEIAWSDVIAGIVLSALSAYVCIHFFLKLLDKLGMFPFVVYRLILGAYLLYVFL